VLDPQEVSHALRELQEEAARSKKIDPAAAARLIMDKLSVESFYKKLDAEHSTSVQTRVEGPGLIEAGLGALADLIKSFK